MTVLRVNGSAHEVATHRRAALLWALRDELGCSSVKYGCGADQCGACRVLIDGQPAASCTITVAEAASREVTTLEGLLSDGRAAGIVDAMIERDAGQCGYCLPGMVTTLVTLLARSNGPPDRTDLVRALDDHLCRCGSHTRILAAACAALGVVDE
jgi:aerobic-type carbon monoxide dehydrogenase small subunit (CoxS/CutS family)